MMDTEAVLNAERLVECLTQKRLTLALAESCTAGLVSDFIVRVSGASKVLWGSFVCYSLDAKERMLGIDHDFLKQFPPVSREVAREMARHALDLAPVSIAAAVTGIAGPADDGSDVPVGTVWTAVVSNESSTGAEKSAGAGGSAGQGNCRETEYHFCGTRAEVRMLAAAKLLEELLCTVDKMTN
jgi:PncC family amidohydrolase